jgi:hypothetical protein
MRNNDSPPQMTVRQERDILVPAPPEADVSNKKLSFGRIATPDRTAGVFHAPSSPAVPGANTPAGAPVVSDTRGASGAWPDRAIGPQPVQPQPRTGDLKYGTTVLGPRKGDGGTR